LIDLARAVPLFSGSKGNSYYIGTNSEGVLIDAGRSCKQIVNAIEANGLKMSNIKAIFITHEHTDHCSAVRVLAKKYNLDVYGSFGTIHSLEAADKIAPETNTYLIENEIAIGNMLVQRIDTPHDAAESCCYRVITSDGKSALIATDMGIMLPQVHQAAVNSDFVVLESNHDIEMLRNGFYPYTLKRRILSDKGHLSNTACAAELSELVKCGTLRLMLGHLSEENNTPRLALSTSVKTLEQAGMKLRCDYTLEVAPTETRLQSVIF
jgi:phosphoribosyl 1,2-cyclic phosphodiesterase